MVRLYWLRVLETTGRLTFLSVAGIFGRSAADLEIIFVTLPTLWLSGLKPALLRVALDFQVDPVCVTFPTLWLSGLGPVLLTVALDFQMDPIFDSIILPLYIPGADFEEGTAAGCCGASAAIIFLSFTAFSARKARLCVCRWTSVPSLCTVSTFFRGLSDVDRVSACLALAWRTFFAKVSSLLPLFRWEGADGFSLLIKDFG